MSGNGTNDATLVHIFFDASPEIRINYYRLKQIDINGDCAYSAIVSVIFTNNKNYFKINPTLVNSVLNVKYFSNDNNLKLEVTDIMGRIVLSKLLIKSNEISVETIGVENLANGIYFANFETNSAVIAERIVVNQ